jgi:two-component system OmpR family sensor kinase/two-component system sensor histidine kinase QseC
MRQDEAAARAQPWSLQRMLVLFAVATTLLAWVSGVAMMAHSSHREVSELHDRELKQIALLLLGMSAHELEEMGPEASISDRIQNGRADNHAALGDDYRYQVWAADGRLLLTNFGLSSPAPMSRFGASGFSWLTMDGEAWRVYTMPSANNELYFQVAERGANRSWALLSLDSNHFALLIASFAIVLAPALAFLRHLLRPLRLMTAALQARSPSNLEPVQIGFVRTEIGAVVAAINALMHRVGDALKREREFTALAAHELRTPLATLRLLAEAVQNPAEEAYRKQDIEALIECADRCAHLQTQLLTLSRLETSEVHRSSEPIDMVDVVMEVMSDLRSEARKRDVRLATRLDDSTLVGHRFGVMTLLRNLASNAVRYSPPGGRVEVETQTNGSDVRLVVDDSGPGIPPAERERAFDRFVRLQHDGIDGVGLGLSIVRVVVDAHNARCELSESPMGGLRVTVTFVGGAAVPGAPVLPPEPDASRSARDTAAGKMTPASAGD